MEHIQRQFVSLRHNCFLSHLDYSYGNVLNCWKLHTLSLRRRYQEVLFFLTDIFNGQNVVLQFWKMLVYTCQIEILETLICLTLTLKVETVLPLDALRRQIPSTVILVYWVDVRSGLIWLASIWHFYYVIHKLSNLWSSKSNLYILYIRLC